MAKRSDVPKFGPLSGIKVAQSAISVAGPYCAEIYAELGADVIWIENAKSPDIAREIDGKGSTVDLDRRNMRTIALDMSTPEGHDVMSKILADIDIFIEASKPGMYKKFGFSDEAMWELNPKLVIVHISGFGQDCTDEYYGRASYDPIAQAFGGLMAMNGEGDIAPFPSNFLVGDYGTGYHCAFAALASYMQAQKTGKGESIDAAQYEIIARMTGGLSLDAWNKNIPYERSLVGPTGSRYVGIESYKCADGNYVYTVILGPGCIKGAAKVLGIEYGGELIPAGTAMVPQHTERGDEFDRLIREYCSAHTAAEVEAEMSANGVPASQILTFADMLEHPLYKHRKTLITEKNAWGDDITTVNVVPKMANNPGQIWRYGPRFGEDSIDILEDLGYDEAQIQAILESKSVIAEKK